MKIPCALSVADPDLEPRGGGGGGLDLLAPSAIFPSVISSFLPKIRGDRASRAPPLDPPLTVYIFVLIGNFLGKCCEPIV